MATYTKRGKSWTARVRKRGIDESQTFSSKGQASAWANQLEADITSGAYYAGTRKTLVDAIERYKTEVTPAKKSADIETVILDMLARQAFANRSLSNITTAMIAEYRDAELQRIKPASVLRYLNVLSGVFEQARREWQWIAVNPCKDLKKPGQSRARDRIFTDDEIQRFLDTMGHKQAATEIQQGICDVFLFAIETAMRASEILGLEWDDIQGRTAILRDTKNSDKRTVALSTKAVEILDSRRDKPRPFGLKRGSLASMFRYYAKQAGIDGVNFHDTRHTAITRMAKKLSPFELARICGHRNMSQTLAYFNETADQIAAKLD
jgi:integrase